MLVIRLFRVGKTNQPSFKIVVTDKRNPPRAGRYVEEVGFWNSVTKEKVLRQDRIKYWLSVGAKPSPTVHNLLISEKIIEGKKIPMHKKKKVKKGTVPIAATAAAPTGEQKPVVAPAKLEVKEEKPAEVLPKKEEPKTETVPAAETPKAERPKAEEPPKEQPKEESTKTK